MTESMILQERYDIQDCIGEGTFASVRKAKSLESLIWVAIKQIYVQRAYLDEAEEEVEKLKNFNNDHIIKIIESFYDSTEFNLNVVLELCNGSLRTKIAEKHIFTEEELISFTTQIVSAFLELERKKIMHLDFKPENVLFADTKGRYYKVCDFGCAQISNISRMSGYEKNAFGTFNYLAPQVYLNYRGKKARSSADIWAFGVTLFEMIFGQLPFTHSAEDENVDRKLAENYFKKEGYQINFDIDEDEISPKFMSLVKKMLTPDPLERINWNYLKKNLVSDFKVPEHMFMNISDVAKVFIPVTELFLKRIKLMKDKINSGNQFWKNKEFLENLREIIIYYFFIFCQQFSYDFEAKVNLVEKSVVNKVLPLMKDVTSLRKGCKDKIKEFERKDLNYRETQLLSELQECMNKISKEGAIDNDMKALSTFCKELHEVISTDKSIFAETNNFMKSLSM